MRSNSRIIALLPACAVALLAGACTTPAPSHNAPPATTHAALPRRSTTATQPAGAADFALPIDTYAYTTQQNVEIVLARSVLTGTCMKSFGFSYDFASDQASNVQARQVEVEDFGLYGNERQYGVTDLAFARRYGYHLPSTIDLKTVRRPKDGPANGLPAMTPQLETVLLGQRPDGSTATAMDGRAIPKDGCLGEADTALSKLGTVGEIPLVGQIRADSFMQSDPRVAAAFKAWSACMRGKGYRYDKPADAGADIDNSTPAVSPREIAVATADVTCKTSANVVPVWSAFEIRYQNQQIRQHPQALKAIADQNKALLTRVGEIIATAGR